METIKISNIAEDGQHLEAVYLPERGMNMVSFRKGGVETIDQSTKELFDVRYAGLGALIGPHFHRRAASSVPRVKDPSLFPHIEGEKARGNSDPFSHGIGRYAPWRATSTESSISAVLTGKDEWNGIPLAELEGQKFQMTYQAEMTPQGLCIEMSVVSDSDSIVGIHYYWHLPEGEGTVVARVKKTCIQENELRPVAGHFELGPDQVMTCRLKEPVDTAFHPFPDPLKGEILLDAGAYKLETSYTSKCQENSWQLYHPKGASFVCIEPVSSQNPRRPNLSVSSIKIRLRIL